MPKKKYCGYKKMEASDIERFSKTKQSFLDGTMFVNTKSDIKVDSRGIVFEREYKKKKVWHSKTQGATHSHNKDYEVNQKCIKK